MRASKKWTVNSSVKLFLLFSLVLLLSLYMLGRFGGWWGESDTVTFTSIIMANLESGSLAPRGAAYANGYAYQALAVFVTQTTGISVQSFQAILAILLAAWVVLPAWLAFRELVRSELVASLAVVVLLAQPEFLFPLLRGSHEKFTRGLMFLCLYLLLRSLRSAKARHIIAFVAAFYLSVYALIAFNDFMASSFILGIILALGLLWVAGLRLPLVRPAGKSLVAKLIYVSLSSLVIVFLFTFYAYPPASQQLQVLRSVWDRLAMLLLQVEDTASNPYLVVRSGWVSMPVYILVSLANWLLLGFTIPIWLQQTYTWFIKRRKAPELHELTLWAFYAAFAFQGLLSIFVDLSGAIAGNLQHRMFPSFAMLAAPVMAVWLVKAVTNFSRWRKALILGMSASLAGLIVLAALKATNEPLMSNYWLFSTPAEYASISWAEQALAERSLWTGLDGRVAGAYFMAHAAQPRQVILDSYLPKASTHDYLVSETNQLFALRTGQQLPFQADSLVTYDNGTSRIYHRRALTPFQR